MTAEQTQIQRRHSARRLAMQAVYSWQLAGQSLPELLGHFRQDIDYPKADPEYFEELVTEVLEKAAELDELLSPYLSREIDQIDPVERAVLRLATFELRSRMDIPYRVVLDEAIGLARKFGATDGHKFVNAVLDKLVKNLRSMELSAEKS